MIPESFQYNGPLTRIIYGQGSISRLGEEVSALGCRRALVVCGSHVGKTALLGAVADALGDACAGVFNAVKPHSGVEIVEAVAARVRELEADVLVALGGGSSSDTAKATAILLAEGGKLPDHASHFTPPDRLVQPALRRPKLPIISIPTTLSGAEFTPGLGIRGPDGHKLLFWDVKVAARLVVLDPAAVMSTPWTLLAASGFNAMAHCVEGLYSRQRQPISDSLALGGLRALDRALQRAAAAPGDPEPFGELLVGAALAGMAIVNARVCIHHAICHCVGARGGVHHGIANAIMLPHTARYNADAVADRLALAAASLDLPANAEALIGRLEMLQIATGVPRRLRDVGVDRAILPQIAADALHDRGTCFNPRPTSTADAILGILEAAW